MAHYPQERRESLVRRMLSKEISMSALARESGIAEATLYRWRDATTVNGAKVRSVKKPTEKHSARQTLAIVVATAALNEAEFSEYCREHGVYPEEVRHWAQACEQAMETGLVCAKQLREAKLADQKRIRELERELRRKDAALAETAALLTLRKKAAAIWGDAEK